MSIIIFLLILSVLVIVHEAGHLFAAKSGGIRVDEFGLGFPPRIAKLFNWRGTDFFLNLLPFGGYVKIVGENPVEGEELSGDSFGAKSRGRQIFVLLAGVLANFLLAWVLFAVIQMIGIESQNGFLKRGFFESIFYGLKNTIIFTGLTIQSLWDLLAGAIVGQADFSSVVGPVGLVGLVGTMSESGFVYVLYLMAHISISLAVINVVPIPALDGGRVFIILIEWIRGKKISPNTFNMMNTVSFIFLILIMILVTIRDVNDVMREFTYT